MEELDHWATGRLLSAAARLVEHEWNSYLSRWDLNHASLAVLHVLLGGPQTQRDLAAAVQVEDQTMSRTVERLERSGYVERRRDPADRRRIVVTLTPGGRTTCLRAGDFEVAEDLVRAGVDDVPGLRRALTGLIRHLSSQRWPEAETNRTSRAASTPPPRDPTPDDATPDDPTPDDPAAQDPGSDDPVPGHAARPA